MFGRKLEQARVRAVCGPAIHSTLSWLRLRKCRSRLAHMLVGGKVSHNLKRTIVSENLIEHPVSKVYRIGDKFVRDVVLGRAAQITHQLGETVLVNID